MFCNNGNTVIVTGNTIIVQGSASGSGTYALSGRTLFHNGRIISNNCSSIEEAKGIVIGLNGGKRW